MLNALRRSLACGVIVAGTLGSVLLTACNSKSGPTRIMLNGAGSTFVNPVMSRWTQIYSGKNPNVRINYQSIGSGGGVQQVKSGTVDFGASDYPLDDQALAQMKPVLQIPETAGPVCITYNLPNLKQPLQLSADVLAGIFSGKIGSWNDPTIAKDNPGVPLPNIKIVAVHRTDGSGTTAAFTTYLSAVSEEWKTKIGKGGSVSWPGGVGGKGSEGVTEQVKQAPGSIGYVELTYAQQNKLPVASVKNKAAKYIQPTMGSTTAAIAGFAKELSNDPRTPIVDPPASAAEAYPISTLTFLIIPKDGTDVGKRAVLKSFASYIINLGQAEASALNYAPLPDSVRQYDQQMLNQMTANGAPVKADAEPLQQ
jgi:phosphate transport system substrate-binding protein